jgi:hypothetical protein
VAVLDPTCDWNRKKMKHPRLVERKKHVTPEMKMSLDRPGMKR